MSFVKVKKHKFEIACEYYLLRTGNKHLPSGKKVLKEMATFRPGTMIKLG